MSKIAFFRTTLCRGKTVATIFALFSAQPSHMVRLKCCAKYWGKVQPSEDASPASQTTDGIAMTLAELNVTAPDTGAL